MSVCFKSSVASLPFLTQVLTLNGPEHREWNGERSLTSLTVSSKPVRTFPKRWKMEVFLGRKSVLGGFALHISKSFSLVRSCENRLMLFFCSEDDLRIFNGSIYAYALKIKSACTT